MRISAAPLLAAALAALLGACASEEKTVAREALVADGQSIAEAQCAACHAVGTYGASPVPDAPPLRHVLAGYSGAALADDFIEGIRVAHDMPAFQFDPKGADALVAYLRSIQDATPEDDPERRRTP